MSRAAPQNHELPPPGPVAPTRQTANESTLLAEIQATYGKSSYRRVIVLAESFEEEFRSSSRLPEVLNLKGLALLLTREADEAASAFSQALALAPDALLGDRKWKNYVRYNHAAALVEAGRPEDALAELEQVPPDAFDPANRLKFHLLRARCLERLSRPTDSLAIWIQLDQRREELNLSEETILSNVDRLLSAASSQEKLEALIKLADNCAFQDRIAFRAVEVLASSGPSTEARNRLREFLKKYPDSSRSQDAASLLRTMRLAVTSGNIAIGLLVPQQGRFATISDRVIQAASLATGIFGSGPDRRIQLVIEDAGQDADTALASLERLHSEHKVAAVIGPILSRGAEAVIQRAEELAIPLISLAQQAGRLGEFSTQAAVTPEMQTHELARHAIQKMGLKRFAILAPRDRFGEEYSHSFWNAIEELGGEITAYETYESGETDFRKAIDHLAGLHYRDARKRELDELAADRERDQIKRRNRRTEQYFALPPIVRFEAVFIPDEPRAASLALPTFAYRDIDSVKILGISAWNSPEFVQRAQKSGEGAVFLDAFFNLAPHARIREFSGRFKAAFGREPSSLEAVAYDSTAILSDIILGEARTNQVDRMQVAERVRRIRDVSGITGKISVREGLWSRELQALTIRDSRIVPWNPPSSPASSAD